MRLGCALVALTAGVVVALLADGLENLLRPAVLAVVQSLQKVDDLVGVGTFGLLGLVDEVLFAGREFDTLHVFHDIGWSVTTYASCHNASPCLSSCHAST